MPVVLSKMRFFCVWFRKQAGNEKKLALLIINGSSSSHQCMMVFFLRRDRLKFRVLCCRLSVVWLSTGKWSFTSLCFRALFGLHRRTVPSRCRMLWNYSQTQQFNGLQCCCAKSRWKCHRHLSHLLFDHLDLIVSLYLICIHLYMSIPVAAVCMRLHCT